MPNVVSFRRLMILGSVLCAVSTLPPANGSGSFIRNGDFHDWSDGSPSDWDIAIGASNGASKPVSEINRLRGGGVVLEGDRTIKAWRLVSQVVPLESGKSYRLRSTAQTEGVVREGNQFDNGYVALMSRDAKGKFVGRTIQEVSRPTDNWESIDVTYVASI